MTRGPQQLVMAVRTLSRAGQSWLAAAVEIENHDLCKTVTADVESHAVLQAFKQCDLLIVHLEQLGITLPVGLPRTGRSG
jgi:hypothetical protein